MTVLFLLLYYLMIVRGFLIHSSDFLALMGLGYVLICQVKDEEKKNVVLKMLL